MRSNLALIGPEPWFARGAGPDPAKRARPQGVVGAGTAGAAARSHPLRTPAGSYGARFAGSSLRFQPC